MNRSEMSTNGQRLPIAATESQKVVTRIAYARDCDLDRFHAKARRGEIPQHAVMPLAVVYAASRKAQVVIGPGHYPIDAIMDAFPPDYVENWLKKQGRRAAN